MDKVYGLTQSRNSELRFRWYTLAIKHGYAGYVGGGKAVWGFVHVADLARGYMAILHYMESTSGDEILQNPYFFIENGEEYSWGRCAEEIGKALHEAGRIQDAAAKQVPVDLYSDLFWRLV